MLAKSMDWKWKQLGMGIPKSVANEYKKILKSCPMLFSFEDYSSACKMSNKRKNRYKNVLPLEGTRFRLQGLKNDYINANNIMISHSDILFNYISTQAPIYNTHRDFWKMVWDSKTSTVIMLTDFMESNKQKATQYWPDAEEKDHYTYDKNKTNDVDSITLTVSMETQVDLDCGILRIFNLSCDDQEERRIYHIQYRNWGDHKRPSSVKDIKLLISYMEMFKLFGELEGLNGPPIIHCSAGIGRTGTFIGCVVVKKLSLSKVKNINVQEIVKQMRKCRGGMVQTNDQYAFIYQFKES